MENPIGKHKIFHTPASMDELNQYIERFSGPDRVIAYTVSGMAWNLASRLVDEAIAEQEKSKAGHEAFHPTDLMDEFNPEVDYVRCTHCGENHEAAFVQARDIEEDEQGADVLTFVCPKTRRLAKSHVYRKA